MGHLGFSYTGLLFLVLLIVPNLLWAKHPPEGYSGEGENRGLLLLERVGEACASCSLLIFSDLNPRREAGLWNMWLAAAAVLMVLYEYWWVRYFRSERKLADFYSSLWEIPVPGAVLPVAALALMGIYGKVIWVLLAALILGVGHIGIHLRHRREIIRKP